MSVLVICLLAECHEENLEKLSYKLDIVVKVVEKCGQVFGQRNWHKTVVFLKVSCSETDLLLCYHEKLRNFIPLDSDVQLLKQSSFQLAWLSVCIVERQHMRYLSSSITELRLKLNLTYMY